MNDLRNYLHGLWLPLVTPFRGGELDENSLRRLVAHYSSGPIDGLILAATSGEGLALSSAELEQLVNLVRPETSAAQRRFEKLEMPGVVLNPLNAVALNEVTDIPRNKVEVDGAARRRAQEALSRPKVVGRLVAVAPLAQTCLGQPAMDVNMESTVRWMLPDQHQCRHVVDARKSLESVGCGGPDAWDMTRREWQKRFRHA